MWLPPAAAGKCSGSCFGVGSPDTFQSHNIAIPGYVRVVGIELCESDPVVDLRDRAMDKICYASRIKLRSVFRTQSQAW